MSLLLCPDLVFVADKEDLEVVKKIDHIGGTNYLPKILHVPYLRYIWK
jgi:hypothetical protein